MKGGDGVRKARDLPVSAGRSPRDPTRAIESAGAGRDRLLPGPLLAHWRRALRAERAADGGGEDGGGEGGEGGGGGDEDSDCR